MGTFYSGHTEGKTVTYTLNIYYHLDCVALEQAPAKWVCEACDASGTARAKHSWNLMEMM